MEWCRLYASLPDQPCVQAAEHSAPGAGWLLIESMCYLTSAESQGFIPRTQVPRFAGPDLDRRVKALVSEEIWLEEDRGYLLNPDIWNEERNLSDAAERKRRADRERMAAKRASERAARDARDVQVSRDSRATGRATSGATPSATSSGDTAELGSPGFPQPPPDLQVVDNQAGKSRDSRAHRREDKKITPPTPPPAWKQPPLMAAVQTEGEGEIFQGINPADIDALIAEVREIRPAWPTSSIRRALTRPAVIERGWALARPAMIDVARRRDSKQPGRLEHDGDWWDLAAAQQAAPPGRGSWPPWCGECTSTEHRWVGEPDTPKRCPNCHPLNDQKAAVS
jgi:hypothetical protein